MNPELRDLIADFRSTQDRAIDFLHGELLIPLPTSGQDWVRHGHRAVLEVLKRLDNPAIKLNPHGFGIDVIHPDFRIDFDYGPNGQIDGFDVWRLAVHRFHRLQAKPPVGPYDDIQTWVDQAVDQQELVPVSDSYNYFLQDPTRLRSPAKLIELRS